MCTTNIYTKRQQQNTNIGSNPSTIGHFESMAHNAPTGSSHKKIACVLKNKAKDKLKVLVRKYCYKDEKLIILHIFGYK